MARRPLVPYRLDAGGIRTLPPAEIAAILRAADSLIARGGRTLLTGILKGSKTRKLLELELDDNPSYGFYKELSSEEILKRVDWMIENEFLEVIYSGQLPLITFTPRGWDIERETYAKELLARLQRMAGFEKPVFNMEFLKDRNRGMILLLLDKIEASGDRSLVPLLRDWAAIDYQKVSRRIREVIRRIEEPEATGGVSPDDDSFSLSS